MVKIAMIAAVADNGIIGKNGVMAWYLPEDLKYFKRMTLGKPVIMGRVTYDGIGRPLPGRPNIVVSRDPAYQPAGVTVVRSFDDAVARAGELAGGADEIMIIGGSQIYAQAIARADRFYLTEVHAHIDGDARFPDWDRSQWRETQRDSHPQSDGRPAYSFVVLERGT